MKISKGIGMLLILGILISGCYYQKKEKEDNLPLAALGLVNGTGSGSTLHRIGGSISGLSASGLVLQNNSSDDLSVESGATSFTFSNQLAKGSSYSVTVKTQPSGFSCTVAGGSGSVSGDVSDISVSCEISCVTRNWGTFCDMKDGTIKFVGTAGTFGGQTYTAQTLYFAKCTHGQTYNSATNDCTGMGSSGDNYGATKVQFCTGNGNTCNGYDANQPVSSGPLFNTCNGSSLAGKSWRVPTKNELKLTIQCTDQTKLPNDGTNCGQYPNPAMSSLFKNTPDDGYWSSSSYVADPLNAYVFDFVSSFINRKTNYYYVRCVSGP
ncbi:MAG: DUF1566 domain-containing protein [Leptospiraceae bacterium]|nr:DUF1566 domain-containing protein [Leptospiraceae bacterium]